MESVYAVLWHLEFEMDTFNDSQAFMMPKENAATVMERDSELTYHVTPDRSTNL